MTNPIGATDEAVRTLLEILGAITSVTLVTAHLDESSDVRNEHEVVDFAEAGTGDPVLVAAGRFLLNQLRMGRVLWRRDEDVVLFFGATSYLLPVLLCRLTGKTVVVEPRGNVPKALLVKWDRRLPHPVARGLAGLVMVLQSATFGLSDGIITYTPAMAEDLGLGRFRHKLYPHGARYVETDRFTVEVPYGSRSRVIGYVGRLEPEKNLELLAAAAKRLSPDVTVHVVGDGELRPWLEHELADEVTNGSVEFEGWVDHAELPALYNELRLLVLPSRTEGLPTTVLEAMACGTPAYASPVAGVPDVVRPGDTGFLIDEADPALVAAEIERLIDDPSTAEVARRARLLVEQEYGFDAATERYRAILRDVGRDRAP